MKVQQQRLRWSEAAPLCTDNDCYSRRSSPQELVVRKHRRRSWPRYSSVFNAAQMTMAMVSLLVFLGSHTLCHVHGFITVPRPGSPYLGTDERCQLPFSLSRQSVDQHFIKSAHCLFAIKPDQSGGETPSNDSINNNIIRLNKVFKATHSRRESDRLIQSGRVEVNGQRVDSNSDFKGVVPYKDIVTLDGKKIRGWEKMNAITSSGSESKNHKPGKGQESTNKNDLSRDSEGPNRISVESMATQFEYIKYWKPVGVICTTDVKISNNIIDEITQRDGYEPKHRVYPIGRLDKDTSGE
jgi:hypothetical protein